MLYCDLPKILSISTKEAHLDSFYDIFIHYLIIIVLKKFDYN